MMVVGFAGGEEEHGDLPVEGELHLRQALKAEPGARGCGCELLAEKAKPGALLQRGQFADLRIVHSVEAELEVRAEAA